MEDPAAAQHLYRIAQEALSNAVRHARADRIAVELRGAKTNWSCGWKTMAWIGGYAPVRRDGVGKMAYRVGILEGEFNIEAAHGGGTLISCRVPRSQPTRNGGERHSAAGGNRT